MFSALSRRPMGWNLIDAFSRLEEREEEARDLEEVDNPDHHLPNKKIEGNWRG